jgi:hypothetical protein
VNLTIAERYPLKPTMLLGALNAKTRMTLARL